MAVNRNGLKVVIFRRNGNAACGISYSDGNSNFDTSTNFLGIINYYTELTAEIDTSGAEENLTNWHYREYVKWRSPDNSGIKSDATYTINDDVTQNEIEFYSSLNGSSNGTLVYTQAYSYPTSVTAHAGDTELTLLDVTIPVDLKGLVNSVGANGVRIVFPRNATQKWNVPSSLKKTAPLFSSNTSVSVKFWQVGSYTWNNYFILNFPTATNPCFPILEPESGKTPNGDIRIGGTVDFGTNTDTSVSAYTSQLGYHLQNVSGGGTTCPSSSATNAFSMYNAPVSVVTSSSMYVEESPSDFETRLNTTNPSSIGGIGGGIVKICGIGQMTGARPSILLPDNAMALQTGFFMMPPKYGFKDPTYSYSRWQRADIDAFTLGNPSLYGFYSFYNDYYAVALQHWHMPAYNIRTLNASIQLEWTIDNWQTSYLTRKEPLSLSGSSDSNFYPRPTTDASYKATIGYYDDPNDGYKQFEFPADTDVSFKSHFFFEDENGVEQEVVLADTVVSHTPAALVIATPLNVVSNDEWNKIEFTTDPINDHLPSGYTMSTQGYDVAGAGYFGISAKNGTVYYEWKPGTSRYANYVHSYTNLHYRYGSDNISQWYPNNDPVRLYGPIYYSNTNKNDIQNFWTYGVKAVAEMQEKVAGQSAAWLTAVDKNTTPPIMEVLYDASAYVGRYNTSVEEPILRGLTMYYGYVWFIQSTTHYILISSADGEKTATQMEPISQQSFTNNYPINFIDYNFTKRTVLPSITPPAPLSSFSLTSLETIQATESATANFNIVANINDNASVVFKHQDQAVQNTTNRTFTYDTEDIVLTLQTRYSTDGGTTFTAWETLASTVKPVSGENTATLSISGLPMGSSIVAQCRQKYIYEDGNNFTPKTVYSEPSEVNFDTPPNPPAVSLSSQSYSDVSMSPLLTFTYTQDGINLLDGSTLESQYRYSIDGGNTYTNWATFGTNSDVGTFTVGTTGVTLADLANTLPFDTSILFEFRAVKTTADNVELTSLSDTLTVITDSMPANAVTYSVSYDELRRSTISITVNTLWVATTKKLEVTLTNTDTSVASTRVHPLVTNWGVQTQTFTYDLLDSIGSDDILPADNYQIDIELSNPAQNRTVLSLTDNFVTPRPILGLAIDGVGNKKYITDIATTEPNETLAPAKLDVSYKRFITK